MWFEISLHHLFCFCQVWLRYDAALPEQDQRYEAVGAAMDKELSVWRPVEEDP